MTEENEMIEAAATDEQPVDTGIEEKAEVAAADDLTITMVEPEEEDLMSLEARVAEMVVEMLPRALEPHLSRLDRRSRERMHAAFAEVAGTGERAQDAIEELQQYCTDLLERIEDLSERLERAEEACGLKPSLLTTAESAVARLDEMAQGGRLRAHDIRAIHRQLRAAVQEERANRQR